MFFTICYARKAYMHRSGQWAVSVSEALLLFWIDILQLCTWSPCYCLHCKASHFLSCEEYKTLMAGNVMLTKETEEELKGLGSLWVIGGGGGIVVHLQPCPLTRGDLGVREYLSHVAALLHFTWLECTVPRNLFLYQWLCRGDRHSLSGQPASFQTGNYISFCESPDLCGLMIQVPFKEPLVYNLFIKSCWRKVKVASIHANLIFFYELRHFTFCGYHLYWAKTSVHGDRRKWSRNEPCDVTTRCSVESWRWNPLQKNSQQKKARR